MENKFKQGMASSLDLTQANSLVSAGREQLYFCSDEPASDKACIR